MSMSYGKHIYIFLANVLILLFAPCAMISLSACSDDVNTPQEGRRLAFSCDNVIMETSRAELNYDRTKTLFVDGTSLGCVISDAEGNFLCHSAWHVAGGFLLFDKANVEGIISRDTEAGDPFVKLSRTDINYNFSFYYPLYDDEKILSNINDYPNRWGTSLVSEPNGDTWRHLNVYTCTYQSTETCLNHSDIMWCNVSAVKDKPITNATSATIPVKLNKKCATIDVVFLSTLKEQVSDVKFSTKDWQSPLYRGKYMDLMTGILSDIDEYSSLSNNPVSLTLDSFTPFKIQAAQDVNEEGKRYDIYRLVILPQREGEFFMNLQFKTQSETGSPQNWTIHLPDNPYLCKLEENTYYRLEIKKSEGTYTWDLDINDWNNDNNEWILSRPY